MPSHRKVAGLSIAQMIPNAPPRSLQTSGLDETTSFGISKKDSAHIMTILRDTLYTDKILAVLREYSANAWDAHRMVGKNNVPIKVVLPSEIEPTLIIRDYGPGLSPDDVFQVYTQYGASTKRDSDQAVGMLGIGSKSGFAYSDSFTISSFHKGVKSTYVAVLDKTNEGVMTLLDRQPCGDETGVEVLIPVQPKDISIFIDKAKSLFRFFDPKPDINTEIQSGGEVKDRFPSGCILEGAGSWTAVMGCIPYKINIDQLRHEGGDNSGTNTFLRNLSGLLFFNIGEVEINASREELKYSDETKKVLTDRFHTLIDDYVKSAIQEVEKSAISMFERRMRLQKLQFLRMAFPESVAPFLSTRVSVDTETDDPKDKKEKKYSFFTSYYKKGSYDLSEQRYLDIRQESFLVLKDDGNRSFRGYNHYDLRGAYFVKSKDGWKTDEPEFNALLDSLCLTGIPIKRLSTLPWSPPYKKSYNSVFNPKHKVSVFKFTEEFEYGANAWEIYEHTPSDTDVYVLLERFKHKRHLDMYQVLHKCLRIAKFLKITLPTIIGYKTTEKKPVDVTKLKGTEFFDWYSVWYRDLAVKLSSDAEFLENLKKFVITEGDSESLVYGDSYLRHIGTAEIKKQLIDELGDDHAICKVLVPFIDGEILFRQRTSHSNTVMDDLKQQKELKKIAAEAEKEFRKAVKQVTKKYPMLGLKGVDLRRFLESGREHFLEYVKYLDEEREKKDGKAQVHADERIAHSCVRREDVHSPEVAAELRPPENGAVVREVGGGSEVPDGLQNPC